MAFILSFFSGITSKVTSSSKVGGLLAAVMAALLMLAGCDATSTIPVQQPTDDMTAEEKARVEQIAAGHAVADTCMGCHNLPSYNNVYPTYNVPKVWGQTADYVSAVFKQYTNGNRAHATMQAQSHTLDENERKQVAAFFANHGNAVTEEDRKALAEAEGQWQTNEDVLQWRAAVAVQAEIYQAIAKAADRAEQREIAKRLATEVNKPMLSGEQLYVAATCDTCHGPGGLAQFMPVVEGVTPYPVIAGQYKSYIAHALAQYRDDPLNPQDGVRINANMRPHATKLSLDEIQRVAEYLQNNTSSLARTAQ